MLLPSEQCWNGGDSHRGIQAPERSSRTQPPCHSPVRGCIVKGKLLKALG